VDVLINGQSIHKQFDLFGPGDVIGINPAMVVRTQPLNWITNFEPNKLPFIEFYDEDFLWRYTPAVAAGERHRPWLCLLMLKDHKDASQKEFEKNDKRLPLPSVTVKSAAYLPLLDQSWAWAHIQINEGYEADSAFETFLHSLHENDHSNADKVIGRLMSPRKLEPNTAYYAFVVPAFETGRLAGLGLDPSGVDVQQRAWDGSSGNVECPIYYEWYFRTGELEDFEYLVKLLEPRVMDARVGVRDMDGNKPGFAMSRGADLGTIFPASTDQAVIGLEGALRSPQTRSRPESLDLTKPFFAELEAILNFPAQLKSQSNKSIDPVVSPPIYGENHALKHEIDIYQSGWLHELNKDPRNRTPAGFGTTVIQKNQEDYVARAWKQVGKILEANRRIIMASFAMQVANTITQNFVKTLSAVGTIQFFSPVLRKVKGSPTTLQYLIEESHLSNTVVSPVFRRLTRKRGPTGRRLLKVDKNYSADQVVKDLNDQKISPAPPKQFPEATTGLEEIIKTFPTRHIPNWLEFLLTHRKWLLFILLLVLIVYGMVTSTWAVVGAVVVIVLGGYLWASRLARTLRGVRALQNPAAMVEVLTNASPQFDFQFVETSPVTPVITSADTQVTESIAKTSDTDNAVEYARVSLHTATGAGDTVEGRNFRKAAIALNQRLSINIKDKRKEKFDLLNAQLKLFAAMDPKRIFPMQLASQVYFNFNPGLLRNPEKLVPALAYPEFDDPMYEKLRDISSELLIPNVDLIPQNTISLLETNPVFIESYMVGLNYEAGKEFLWRELPGDARGSYFRQFWDVKGIVQNTDGATDEELVERYRDITPIDTWYSTSRLGTHKVSSSGNKKQLVLVIRGELLKKYPDTIIYVQKAHIYRDAEGRVDASHEPVIIEVATNEQMMTEIKFPIFKAEILPDIKFFGFDLTIEDAMGDENPSAESNDWGWYFVLQQIPGSTEFGMDIQFDPDDDPDTPISWDDLSWDRFTDELMFINTSIRPGRGFSPGKPGENINQWGSNSANMAYILYQKPAMIAIHAREMLADLE
jgi:hypothetical protein